LSLQNPLFLLPYSYLIYFQRYFFFEEMVREDWKCFWISEELSCPASPRGFFVSCRRLPIVPSLFRWAPIWARKIFPPRHYLFLSRFRNPPWDMGPCFLPNPFLPYSLEMPYLPVFLPIFPQGFFLGSFLFLELEGQSRRSLDFSLF